MSTDTDTKTKILDTAEILFANKGVTGTSIRTIVREAGVNIAAIHYHFGSKEALFQAVLTRRAEPVNRERLRLLDQLESVHPSGRLPLELVIHAFMAPLIRMRFLSSTEGDLFPQLMYRARVEQDETITRMVHDVFESIIERFVPAFGRALPHLDRKELIWRIHCMIGVMAFTLIIPKGHDVIMDRYIDLHDPDSLSERLIAFTAAGMRQGNAESAGRGSE